MLFLIPLLPDAECRLLQMIYKWMKLNAGSTIRIHVGFTTLAFDLKELD